MPTIDFDLKCIRCGESLAGLSLSEYCAKCGLTSGDSLNTSVLEPATAEVNADVACVGCGYNLRTLALGTVCPECATPVHKSLRPDDLCFADARWLKSIRLGLGLVAVTFVLALMQIVLPPLAALFWGPTVLALYYGSGASMALGLGMVVIWCVGLLLITTQESARALDHRGRRLRSWIRVLGILAPVTFLCNVGFTIVVGAISGGGAGFLQGGNAAAWPRICLAIMYLVIAPLGICSQGGAVLLGLFLRNLAVRDRRRTGLYVALIVASSLYGVAALVSLPLTYLLVSNLGANPGSMTSSAFFTLFQISRGAHQLAGLAFGLVGLLAVLLARRMIAGALNQRR